MKSIHISGMERLRSINLRIGFASALILSILAMNWTTERTSLPVFEEATYPFEVTLKPFVVNQLNKPEQPPAMVMKPNDHILAVSEPIAVSMAATPLFDTSSQQVNPHVDVVKPQPINPYMPQIEPETPTEKEIFVIVEEMPSFSGCDDHELTKQQRLECSTNKLLKYLNAHIQYPEIARQNGIEGTVYVRFVVEKDGSITNSQVVREIGGGCGAEALRVVSNMPNWLPGKQRNRAVRVQLTLPVKFTLY